MKKRYVFFVNAAYCYAIFRPLQQEIRKRGGEVAWFFLRELSPVLKDSELLLKDEQEVRQFAPDVMFAAGDWLPYYLPGLKVELFHGIARNKRGTATSLEGDDGDHYRIRGWYDLYCTHAEQDTKKFSELAESCGHFRVKKTGWPKLDPLFSRSYQKNPAASGQAKRPTVFFASTFSHSITAAPILADTIEALSHSGKWNFVATLHPLMADNIVARYQAMQHEHLLYLPPETDLIEAMADADVMLCDTSSIMYEFMLLDKPVVTFRTRNPGPFLLDVKKAEEVEKALQQVLAGVPDQQQAARELCRQLHESDDGNSSSRVLDAVDEMLAEGLVGLKRKPWNIIRKFKLRERLGYWGR